MRRFHFGVILVVLLPALATGQTTYYVNAGCGNDAWAGLDPNCGDPNDPNDLDGPKATIQAAIGVAGTDDTIIVAAGTYQENIYFGGKQITVRSSDPNDPSGPMEKTRFISRSTFSANA